MTFERATRIADAVLFEGYALYPYRASSTKNRYRWTFGVVMPQSHAGAHGDEPRFRAAECLVTGEHPAIRARLRFLQVERRIVEALRGERFEPVDVLELGTERHVPWEEGVLREVDLELPPGDALRVAREFRLEGGIRAELLRDESGGTHGRVQRVRSALEGALRVRIESLRDDPEKLWRLEVRVENVTATEAGLSRAEMMSSSLVSAHLLLSVQGGEFVSLLDPPDFAAPAAATCARHGLHPVLVGASPRSDLVLCAPIILDEPPRIAPESTGDFFDATEIDELLTLRTLALTPDEKHEARATDPRTAALLARVESTDPDALARLHGAVREYAPLAVFRPGVRVRLRPGKRRTDAQDSLMVGRIATIQEVRQDIDGSDVLAVTLDDDPAAELHRWYGRFHHYYLDEVELVAETAP